MDVNQTKKWLVNYTMHDGESEYGDSVVLEAKCKRAANSTVGRFFSEFWGSGTKRTGDCYEEKIGYRIAEVESIVEIPENDFQVLIKYNTNISNWKAQ